MASKIWDSYVLMQNDSSIDKNLDDSDVWNRRILKSTENKIESLATSPNFNKKIQKFTVRFY